MADEWNARKPIEDLQAVAQGTLTAFFPTGELAKLDGKGEPLHPMTEMAVTFPGQDRRVVEPRTVDPTAAVVWETGKVQVARVEVDVKPKDQQLC